MKQQIEALVQREMTRKEFLATLGLGVVSVMGFGSIVKLLTGKGHSLKQNMSVSSGYSSSTYGGGKD